MASAFAERWKGASDPADMSALETALVELWESGRDAWPDVPLEARAFATYVGERASAKLAPLAAVGEVRAADAFLACACTMGLPSAIRAFDSNLLLPILDYVQWPALKPNQVPFPHTLKYQS